MDKWRIYTQDGQDGQGGQGGQGGPSPPLPCHVTGRSPPVVTTACPVGHLLEKGSAPKDDEIDNIMMNEIIMK